MHKCKCNGLHDFVNVDIFFPIISATNNILVKQASFGQLTVSGLLGGSPN